MGEALAILRTAAGATWLGVAWREGGLITKRPLGVGDDVCLLRGLAICIVLLPEVAMANANVASMSVDALLKFREDTGCSNKNCDYTEDSCEDRIFCLTRFCNHVLDLLGCIFTKYS